MGLFCSHSSVLCDVSMSDTRAMRVRLIDATAASAHPSVAELLSNAKTVHSFAETTLVMDEVINSVAIKLQYLYRAFLNACRKRFVKKSVKRFHLVG